MKKKQEFEAVSYFFFFLFYFMIFVIFKSFVLELESCAYCLFSIQILCTLHNAHTWYIPYCIHFDSYLYMHRVGIVCYAISSFVSFGRPIKEICITNIITSYGDGGVQCILKAGLLTILK